MPGQTPGDDFPLSSPEIHPGVAKFPCSHVFVTDSSASLNIISNNLRLPSLEHQDEGGSLLPGGHEAGTDVCELSQLAPAAGGCQAQLACPISTIARSQLGFTSIRGTARAPAFSQHLPHWWLTPFCGQVCRLPLAETRPLPSHPCLLPSLPS